MSPRPSSRRHKHLLLLFNDQPGSEPNLTKKTEDAFPRYTFLRMVKTLAQRILPESEWTVHDYASIDELRKEWLSDKASPEPDEAAPKRYPDLVIADMWFENDDASHRNPIDADRARRLLQDIKARWRDSVRILTATLPEPAAIDPRRTDSDSDRTEAVVDHFLPIAHSNLNGWDELFNLIKTEESRILFRHARDEAVLATNASELKKASQHWLLAKEKKGKKGKKGKRRTGRSEESKPVPCNVGLILDGVKKGSIDIEHVAFKGFLIVRNCELECLRFRNCYFFGPVLFENCTFKQTSVVAGCKFFAHFNLHTCVFEQDFYIERCDFAPKGRVAYELLDDELANLQFLQFETTPSLVQPQSLRASLRLSHQRGRAANRAVHPGLDVSSMRVRGTR